MNIIYVKISINFIERKIVKGEDDDDLKNGKSLKKSGYKQV